MYSNLRPFVSPFYSVIKTEPATLAYGDFVVIIATSLYCDEGPHPTSVSIRPPLSYLNPKSFIPLYTTLRKALDPSRTFLYWEASPTQWSNPHFSQCKWIRQCGRGAFFRVHTAQLHAEHDLRFVKNRFRLLPRVNVFSLRVENACNCLLSEVVHTSSVNYFKRSIDLPILTR